MKKYDYIFVGMGPSSIFCVYELLRQKTNKKILMIEKGKSIDKRKCPISKTKKCIKCKPICNIIGGFSGAGAFSDGKLLSYHLAENNKNSKNLYIGGKDDSYIKQFYTNKEITNYLKYTDKLYLELGASKNLEGINRKEEIKNLQNLATENGLELINVPIRHLGTEKSHELYKKIQDYLVGKVDMIFEKEVTDLIISNNKISGIKLADQEIFGNNIVLGVGVDGSSWLEKLCKKYNIATRVGYMDIGIRYELPDKTMKQINDLMYEGKFIGYIGPHKDKVRTYCQNPSGFVTPETYDNGCTLVNGHSYKDKKSNNTNLAILVSYKFKKPFNNPIEYCFNIAKSANLLTGGNAIIQRYGDFVLGKETTNDKLIKNKVKPTADSMTPGDLTTILSYRTIENIKEFIDKISKVIPNFNDSDNLLYGPEIKFYSNELVLSDKFETSVENLYSIGTGGGLTIGLMMASVSGVMLAHKIERVKLNEEMFR